MFKFEEDNIKGQILFIKVTSQFYICGNMTRKKELSNYLKLLIVKLLKSRICKRKVAQTFGCALSIVCKILKKYRSRNDVRNLPRSCRPRVT